MLKEECPRVPTHANLDLLTLSGGRPARGIPFSGAHWPLFDIINFRNMIGPILTIRLYTAQEGDDAE